jgi:hypothetical protein
MEKYQKIKYRIMSFTHKPPNIEFIYAGTAIDSPGNICIFFNLEEILIPCNCNGGANKSRCLFTGQLSEFNSRTHAAHSITPAKAEKLFGKDNRNVYFYDWI